MMFGSSPRPSDLEPRCGCAYAKKQPKFQPARALTPEQAALVQKAIAQEKVLIKNIQQRTPLVETYIQDTKPDVKLYAIPVADHYMLSRVDFGKTFFDKTYTPKQQQVRHGFFKGSHGYHHGPHQSAAPGYAVYLFQHRLHGDDVPRSHRLRPAALCFSFVRGSFWVRCAPGSSMCIPRPT